MALPLPIEETKLGAQALSAGHLVDRPQHDRPQGAERLHFMDGQLLSRSSA
jgi:hypothetical protein